MLARDVLETGDIRQFLIDWFGRNGSPQLYPAGMELFREGSAAEEIYFVEAGLIKLVHVAEQGQQLILGLRSSGGVLGTYSAILGMPYMLTAVTLSPCKIRRVAATEFLALIRSDRDASWSIQQLHSREIADLLQHEVILRTSHVRDRLVYFMCRYLAAVGSLDSAVPVRLDVPLKQHELAQFLSVTPEHLSRVEKQLAEEGVINRDKGWLIVVNPARLAQSTQF